MNQSGTVSSSIFTTDIFLFTAYIIGTFEVVFWLLNGLLIYIEYNDFPSIDQYRLQPKKKKLRYQPDIVRLIVKGTIRHQISTIFLTPLLYYILNYFGHLEMHSQRPPWSTILFQLGLFIVSEDAIFFWTHYLLHSRWLYQHVHKQHHVYKQPTGVVSVLSHPLEGLQNQLSIWFMPVLIKEKHIFTLCLWIAIRVYQTVNAHCGYNFPYVSTQYWFSSIMSGPLAHDYHHEYGKDNYGSFFNFWDRCMGTHRLSKNRKQTN